MCIRDSFRLESHAGEPQLVKSIAVHENVAEGSLHSLEQQLHKEIDGLSNHAGHVRVRRHVSAARELEEWREVLVDGEVRSSRIRFRSCACRVPHTL
eukprot:1359823-Prymnesium_polylepis.2